MRVQESLADEVGIVCSWHVCWNCGECYHDPASRAIGTKTLRLESAERLPLSHRRCGDEI
jgi:hypothetical protein